MGAFKRELSGGKRARSPNGAECVYLLPANKNFNGAKPEGRWTNEY